LQLVKAIAAFWLPKYPLGITLRLYHKIANGCISKSLSVLLKTFFHDTTINLVIGFSCMSYEGGWFFSSLICKSMLTRHLKSYLLCDSQSKLLFSPALISVIRPYISILLSHFRISSYKMLQIRNYHWQKLLHVS